MKWLEQQRWTALASMAGGVLWMIGGLNVLPSAVVQPMLYYLARLALIPAALLLFVTLPTLYYRWRVHPDRLARLGLGCSCSALALIMLGTLSDYFAVWRWVPLSHDSATSIIALGLLLLSIGLVLLGSAILHRAEQPGWQALPLMLGLLGLFLPIGAGIDGLIGFVVWLLFGLGWLWIGGILWIERQGLPAPQQVTLRQRS